jgi:hypothetical protein
MQYVLSTGDNNMAKTTLFIISATVSILFATAMISKINSISEGFKVERIK